VFLGADPSILQADAGGWTFARQWFDLRRSAQELDSICKKTNGEITKFRLLFKVYPIPGL
jgi:hypothetical protein